MGADERYGARHSFGHGFRWSMAMNVGQQVGSLGVTFLLAALLGPRAFGVVAMASVFIAFIQLLVQQGMAAAIVQRPDLDDDDLDTAFWLLGATSLALAGLSLLASGWWATVNDLPELRWVIMALTPLVLFKGLLIVPDAILRRRMDFRPLALRTNASVLIGGAVGVVGALAGWGIAALVAQQLVAGAIEVVVVWAAVDWRPRRRWSRASASSLVSFTAPSMVGSVAVFAQSRADAAIAGFFFGPAAVGVYRFGARLVETATDAVTASFRAVALPELAQHQRDRTVFGRRLTEVIGFAAAAVCVPLAGLAAGAPAVIEVLGDEWRPAVPVVVILSLAGAARTVASLNTPALQAMGRPGVLAVLSWVGAALSATGLVIVGAVFSDRQLDDQVVALAVTISAFEGVVVLGLTAWILVRLVGVRPWSLLRSIAPAVLAGGIGFGAGWALDTVVVGELVPVLRMVLVGGTAAGLAGLVVLQRSPELRATLRRALRGGADADEVAALR